LFAGIMSDCFFDPVLAVVSYIMAHFLGSTTDASIKADGVKIVL
jgi:hypothetical protein